MNEIMYEGNLYSCSEAAGYVAAINILAVEYLVRTNNPKEYARRVNQVCSLSMTQLDELDFVLELNRHISTLGAMITHGDYGSLVVDLLMFLDTCNQEEQP